MSSPGGAQPTDNCSRQLYGGMEAEEAKRLTHLEKENARSKKLVADAELEKAMLTELAGKNLWTGVLKKYIAPNNRI